MEAFHIGSADACEASLQSRNRFGGVLKIHRPTIYLRSSSFLGSTPVKNNQKVIAKANALLKIIFAGVSFMVAIIFNFASLVLFGAAIYFWWRNEKRTMFARFKIQLRNTRNRLKEQDLKLFDHSTKIEYLRTISSKEAIAPQTANPFFKREEREVREAKKKVVSVG